jgi:hypothetical protein
LSKCLSLVSPLTTFFNIMSDALDDLSDDFITRIVVQLNVYSSSKDGKGKVKEVKSTKNKELDFTLRPDNYMEFLWLS